MHRYGLATRFRLHLAQVHTHDSTTEVNLPRREVAVLPLESEQFRHKQPSSDRQVATKRAFRDPLKFRRCLIPADAFYEWKRTGAAKQPYCFEVNEGELFAFAGLWDGWKDANGNWTRTCSILTTTPNAGTASIHDRMPVILSAESYDPWLDPGITNVRIISELLKPRDAKSMRYYAVSSRVNHVGNDDEECSRPLEIAEVQPNLFR